MLTVVSSTNLQKKQMLCVTIVALEMCCPSGEKNGVNITYAPLGIHVKSKLISLFHRISLATEEKTRPSEIRSFVYCCLQTCSTCTWATKTKDLQTTTTLFDTGRIRIEKRKEKLWARCCIARMARRTNKPELQFKHHKSFTLCA